MRAALAAGVFVGAILQAPTGAMSGVEDASIGRGGSCDRYVAPSGDNRHAGTRRRPWASMEFAVRHVADRRCTVWFRDGRYTGTQELERRFVTRTTLRAIHPLRARFVSDDAALDIGGNAGNLMLRGFEFRQRGPSSDGVLVYVSGSDDGRPAPDHVWLVGNVIHDSWGDDLLKIRSGAERITVAGNVFYNQASGEQHIDVNGVSNVTIEGNIFFNDFGGSDRSYPGDTKHYIVVKDSNAGADGARGSRRIGIEGNVFLRWQGGDEPLIGIGNDGAGYLEARHVKLVNNLVVGNNRDRPDTVVGISGAADVTVTHTTVIGDLPTDSYAMDVGTKGSNPRNRDITFANNIWSDPSGSMGELSDGERRETVGLTVRRNLYWNGGKRIVWGDLLRAGDDPTGIFRNPRLRRDQRGVALPSWEGSRFRSGNRTIGQEFLRLVRRFGRPDPDGAGVDRANPALSPKRDILGRWRGDAPDLGAYEL